VIGSTERAPDDVIVDVVVDGQEASKTHLDFRVAGRLAAQTRSRICRSKVCGLP